MQAFEVEFGHHYFVQFDDIGDLLFTAGLQGAADLLSDISAIQDNSAPASLVYVTSRSPLFYLLGADLLESRVLDDWTSPSSVHSVVLDSLNADHILQMMPTHLDPDASRTIAEAIFDRTGGVPRFIVGALDMLDRKAPNEWLSSVKGNALLDHLGAKFANELFCWRKLLTSDVKTREMAVELIRLASLSVPFRLSENLGLYWAEAIKAQLPNYDTLSLTAVPILLCSIFPLYVTRVALEEKKESEGLWRFVIPPVCLEALTTSYERLPIMQPIQSTSTGEYLEVVVQRCVRLRVSDAFLRTRVQKTETLFPFMSGTPMGEEKMNCRGYATFPKIVKEHCEKSLTELTAIMKSAGDNRPMLESVNMEHLPQILKLMRTDVLSVSMEKSHSADLFYMTEGKHLIEWQMKGGAQVLQPAAAVDELLQSSSQCIGDPLLSLTFIFVCLEGVSKKFFECTQASSETDYAFHFKPVLNLSVVEFAQRQVRNARDKAIVSTPKQSPASLSCRTRWNS